MNAACRLSWLVVNVSNDSAFITASGFSETSRSLAASCRSEAHPAAASNTNVIIPTCLPMLDIFTPPSISPISRA